MTDNRLMTPGELEQITGFKRYSKQAQWFKRMFGVDVVSRDDRSIVMTWATYEALSAKKAGVAPVGAPVRQPVEICSPFA